MTQGFLADAHFYGAMFPSRDSQVIARVTQTT